jgi:uncharacterized protein (DUF2147 family)
MKRLVLAAALLAAPLPVAAQSPSVMGVWLTQSKSAHVRLAPCADVSFGPICGTVVALLNPKGPDGNPIAPEAAADHRNPDPNLKTRKIMGMSLVWGFKKTSNPNVFESGHIYNGEDGKTYDAEISLNTDGTLRLRGYVGTPMFGQTQTWTRVQ